MFYDAGGVVIDYGHPRYVHNRINCDITAVRSRIKREIALKFYQRAFIYRVEVYEIQHTIFRKDRKNAHLSDA